VILFLSNGTTFALEEQQKELIRTQKLDFPLVVLVTHKQQFTTVVQQVVRTVVQQTKQQREPGENLSCQYLFGRYFTIKQTCSIFVYYFQIRHATAIIHHNTFKMTL